MAGGATIAWGGAPPWAAAALALLVVVAAALQYRGLRARVPARAALGLTALRVAALGLVLVLIAGPRAVRRGLQPVRRPVAVVVDVSRSMSLRGGLATTRLERVQSFLGSREFLRVAGGFLPSYFSFADAAAPLAPGDVAKLRPEGGRTDLAGAVRAAGAAGSPAAVVVFTDGGHDAPGSAAGGAESAVPVVFVGVGADERPRDLELVSAEPPAIAFAGQPVQVQAVVRASGFAGREVPVLLAQGEQVLVSRTVRLPEDGAEAAVTLEWTPPAPGRYPLSVRLPAQDGEQVAENNRVDLPVDVVRDKIRVLFVSGSPGWNYRFLRGALKGDPSLDVVSFIILRSASDAVDVPQQELSLIPFPTQKIFLEELGNFDLLIFDNFAYQPYLPSTYLDKVEEFVRGGGGFWMLGGPQSYLGGRYQQSPLAPLLPVVLPATAPAGGAFSDVTVQPRLTAAGRTHPVFQGLAERPGDPPPLTGYNLSGPARPGAVVLADVAGQGGARQPLVVAGRHGRGRVLAVLTDGLWNWAFEEAGRGRGNRAFLAFVRQAVRWSIGDAQLQPLRVEPERARLAPGEPLRARIRVLGEDFLPAAAPELTVTLRGPDGTARALAPTAEAPGTYRVEAGAPAEGTWEIAATAAARGAVYARAAASVSVAWPPAEFRSPGLNRDALAAQLAGRRGALLELGAPRESAAAIERALGELVEPAGSEREESRPLAELLPVFLAFLALVSAEWYLRRRLGLD